VKSIKSESDEQKQVVSFSGKNRGVTPSVAAPGVTHPSDATAGDTFTDWTAETVDVSDPFTRRELRAVDGVTE